MALFDAGRSNGCEENLCENAVRGAVEAAFGGNAGDMQCVCSSNLLMIDRTTGKTKRGLPYDILRRKDRIILRHPSIDAAVQHAVMN